MPIWLRKFTFKRLQSFYSEEKEAHENKGKSGSQTVINADGTIKAPDLLRNSQSSKKPVKYG